MHMISQNDQYSEVKLVKELHPIAIYTCCLARGAIVR